MLSEEILRLPPEKAYSELKRISIETTDENTAWYAQWWASDAQLLLGKTKNAIEEYPPSSSLRSQLQTERRLSLKLAENMAFDAHDILTLFGPKVTKFGRENLPRVTAAINAIHSQETPNTLANSLKKWATDSPQKSYSVYLGASVGFELDTSFGIRHHKFGDSKQAQRYCIETIRQAENMVREDQGIPHVNEGWVSETKLYYEIRSAFSSDEVQQHSSPSWLGRQHLDIFLPKRKVGIEYQGLQHDEPVAYFGGVEAFEKQRARDERKRQLCKRNNISLIYVRPGYDLAEVVNAIESATINP